MELTQPCLYIDRKFALFAPEIKEVERISLTPCQEYKWKNAYHTSKDLELISI
jgi:hypothetical protein